MRRSLQGVLLVEAVLSAVVIAVGLTFITRALGSQLKALQRVEEYAVLTNLAQRALRTREADVQASRSLSGLRDGAFEAPYAAYQWTISAAALETPDLAVRASRVTLSVHRSDPPGPTYSVQMVWPSDFVPLGWFSS